MTIVQNICIFAVEKFNYNIIIYMDIKKVFARHGLTATQVAERMGIPLNNLSMAINGNPTYKKLCDIAKAVGCSPSELIADDEDMKATTVICPHCGAKLTIKVDSENE